MNKYLFEQISKLFSHILSFLKLIAKFTCTHSNNLFEQISNLFEQRVGLIRPMFKQVATRYLFKGGKINNAFNHGVRRLNNQLMSMTCKCFLSGDTK